MARGFSVVALDNVKCNSNVGSVLRASGNFNVPLVVLGGSRYNKSCTDTMKYHRHNPVLQIDNVLDCIPYDCVPVAVDLVEGAVDITEYKHPERAYYIFGAEDATLGEKVLSKCRDRIFIPSNRCFNLAGAVHIVLYDRFIKTQQPQGVE